MKPIIAFSEKHGLASRFDDVLKVGGSSFTADINFSQPETKNLLKKETGFEGIPVNLDLVCPHKFDDNERKNFEYVESGWEPKSEEGWKVTLSDFTQMNVVVATFESFW